MAIPIFGRLTEYLYFYKSVGKNAFLSIKYTFWQAQTSILCIKHMQYMHRDYYFEMNAYNVHISCLEMKLSFKVYELVFPL